MIEPKPITWVTMNDELVLLVNTCYRGLPLICTSYDKLICHEEVYNKYSNELMFTDNVNPEVILL